MHEHSPDPAAIAMPEAAPNETLDGLSQLEAVARENEALSRELLRCYEQLNLVYEITEHLANLQDPRVIQDALLRRYATMLNLEAVFLDEHGNCQRMPLDERRTRYVINGSALGSALRDDIEIVRNTRRPRVAELSESQRRLLGGCGILLAALHQVDGPPVVVLAIRAGHRQPFDSADMLAAESVLSYGAHIVGNLRMVRHLQQTSIETVAALANAIDAKDNYTSGHSQRVGWLAKLVGRAMQLPANELQNVEWAGLLHDVGKIGVPEHILNKPGKLTDEEFDQIKRHPRQSFEVLRPVASLEPILGAVLYHHENHDGSGYPEGLSADQIPLGARIIHVVDIFDALTSTRAYRRGFTVEKAFAILREGAGKVTDPHVTDVFINVFSQYMESQPQDFCRRFAHIAVPEDVAVEQISA